MIITDFNIRTILNGLKPENELDTSCLNLVKRLKSQLAYKKSISEYDELHAEKGKTIKLGKFDVSLDEVVDDYDKSVKKDRELAKEILSKFNPSSFKDAFESVLKDPVYEEYLAYKKDSLSLKVMDLFTDIQSILSLGESYGLMDSFEEDTDLYNVIHDSNEEFLEFSKYYNIFFYNGNYYDLSFMYGQGTGITLERWPIEKELCKIYADNYSVDLTTLLSELKEVKDED